MNRNKLLSLLAIAALVVLSSGCTSNEVEAGHVAYMYQKPLIFGGGGFKNTVSGPAREVAWRLYKVDVDVRPTTKDEIFELQCADELKVTFHVHTKISIDTNRVQEIVEKYSEKWYDQFIKQEFRNFVFDSAKDYSSRDAKDNREKMREYILHNMKELTKDTPFIVEDVVVGNIQYDPRVAKAVELKMAKQQDLETKGTEVEVAKKEADKRRAEAKGIAEAQKIIDKTLSDEYLYQLYVEALKKAANSPSRLVFLPSSKDGLTLVKTIDSAKEQK